MIWGLKGKILEIIGGVFKGGSGEFFDIVGKGADWLYCKVGSTWIFDWLIKIGLGIIEYLGSEELWFAA